MNTLITGGSGFIGSALVDFLVNKGYIVTIVSRQRLKLKGINVIRSTQEIPAVFTNVCGGMTRRISLRRAVAVNRAVRLQLGVMS